MAIDLFSSDSAQYAASRPSYPPELFQYLAEQAPGRDAAWDCATGNGQAAAGLLPFFDRVYASDISREQLDNPVVNSGVIFSCQPAVETHYNAAENPYGKK